MGKGEEAQRKMGDRRRRLWDEGEKAVREFKEEQKGRRETEKVCLFVCVWNFHTDATKHYIDIFNLTDALMFLNGK